MTVSHLRLSCGVLAAQVCSPAFAVGCGDASNQPEFAAVCGISRQCIDPECPGESGCVPPCEVEWPAAGWGPVGSGVLIAPNMIITARHFIDANTPPGPNCSAQFNRWFAYFKGCPAIGSNDPCASICFGENEDMIRVPIQCFIVGDTGFAGTDVIIGIIEPQYVPCLSHITPIPISTPKRMGLCVGHPVFIAGWGEVWNESCKNV